MRNARQEETDAEQVTATVERYDGEVDVCTLHPVDPDDDEELTAWISAEKGSFCTVHELR
ncbi:DUF7511 domain-containing protein [Halorubrum sp. DTA98]|uniref:DUF7511 domain-containing protein n=1 Tax=Halorubrum sp. DTA98 TaxID=3402163 RepID=UPI003AAE56AF